MSWDNLFGAQKADKSRLTIKLLLKLMKTPQKLKTFCRKCFACPIFSALARFCLRFSPGQRKQKYGQLPSLYQWKSFFRVLSKKEKVLFLSFLFLFLGSSSYLSVNFYFQNTKVVPSPGGIYREGIVGQPRLINPIYAISDAERDLKEILFSGLMKHGPGGEIIPDLAEKYEIKEGGKVYKFYLRENLRWSDNTPLTVDDVIFTVRVLQDPAYRSPYLANWLNVGVEKINERQVKFSLKNPYLPFLELTTSKIIPKHIWEKVPPQNFPFARYNLSPVTSGPYKIEKISRDDLGYITSVTLVRNNYYFGQIPYIEKIILSFLSQERDLLEKVLKQEIDGFSFQTVPEKVLTNFKLFPLRMPRYFALFLNPEKNKILTDKGVRQALNYATNRRTILEKALQGRGKIILSPILPEIFGFEPPTQIYEQNLLRAEELLEKAGFKMVNEKGIREKVAKKEIEFEFKSDLVLGSRGEEVRELQKCLARDVEIYPGGEITGYFGKLTKTAVIRFQEKYASVILTPHGLRRGTGRVGQSTRKKLNELCARVSTEILPLKLELITVNQPQLKKVAQLLKEQWQELGIDLEIKTFSLAELEKNHLRPRDFEILLFGQALGKIPDLFPFWHSKQKKDPGLNLANYENEEVDKLLVNARQARDFESLKEYYEKLQNILLEDVPALFLYSPFYLYFHSPIIKGFETELIVTPSKRFTNIENWYIKTKRVWK